MISKKSNIAIIGAGKIAYSLVYALKNSGYNVKFIISSNLSSSKHLARKYSIKEYSNNIEELNSQIRIFLISVPDNQIEIVSRKLAKLKLRFDSSVFIHLSGAENISNLNSLKNRGGATASFHMMQTFPSKKITKIDDCYAAIETNNKIAERYLFNLANDLNLKAFKITSKDKVKYHLAGVFASNFLTGNIFNSEMVFNINHINRNLNNSDFMAPIINSTLNNIKKHESAKALSGPVERGDLRTVKKHISSLKKFSNNKNGSNVLLISYLIQSLNLMDAVKSKYKILNEQHLMIKNYLLDELKQLKLF
jgi:predicted short-subunit dehydrogenase-like oxidoreductase (DUF2520 family)